MIADPRQVSVLLEGCEPWPEDFVQRYRAEGYWRDETLGVLLRTWAQRSGQATALVDGEQQISYAELDRRVDSTAAGLRDLGISPSDRVVVQLPNVAEFVIVLFALIRCQAVPVLALPAHRRTEVEHFVAVSEAVGYVIPAMFGGFDYRTLAAEVMSRSPSLRHVLVAGEAGAFTELAQVSGEWAPDPALPPPDPAAVAVLLISGGTTGKPKLIPRTHRDYAYLARASAEVCEFTADDVYLACLPVAHNFPLACPGVLGTLGAGGTVVMSPAPSPDVAFALIERERVTVTSLVPPLVRLWLDMAEWASADWSSLRLLQVGGAKLDEQLARKVQPVLGGRLQQGFGMAEGLLSYTRPEDSDDLVVGTQGRPISPADEVRVVDHRGTDVAPGEVGELWTRGPYTLRGYYRAPEHNATVFSPDGFFRTGDLVRQLPSGHLVIEGRLKDVVNRGGEKVAAGELEEHLLAYPTVAQAAVVGVPDETLGELVCAVIRLAPGTERAPRLKELQSFVLGRGLARYKLPDKLVTFDDFPVTAVGKIDKWELIRRITEKSR
ncbi:MAG: (2,3-dihydroxybenzoyl)adenylate synthase [Pseudonocardiaceae bacterium]